jgi:hypothetical protein
MTNNSPTLAWMGIAFSADGKQLTAAALKADGMTAFSNSILTSTDFGVTWASNNVPANTWYSIASSADGNKLVATTLYGGIWTYQTTPKPRLNISCLSNSLTVAWMVPATDFELQQNYDPTSTNWITVTNTPTLNCSNLQNEVVLSVPDASSFYRLVSRQ